MRNTLFSIFMCHLSSENLFCFQNEGSPHCTMCKMLSFYISLTAKCSTRLQCTVALSSFSLEKAGCCKIKTMSWKTLQCFVKPRGNCRIRWYLCRFTLSLVILSIVFITILTADFFKIQHLLYLISVSQCLRWCFWNILLWLTNNLRNNYIWFTMIHHRKR